MKVGRCAAVVVKPMDVERHARACSVVYEHYLMKSTCTFEEEPPDLAPRQMYHTRFATMLTRALLAPSGAVRRANQDEKNSSAISSLHVGLRLFGVARTRGGGERTCASVSLDGSRGAL